MSDRTYVSIEYAISQLTFIGMLGVIYTNYTAADKEKNTSYLMLLMGVLTLAVFISLLSWGDSSTALLWIFAFHVIYVIFILALALWDYTKRGEEDNDDESMKQSTKYFYISLILFFVLQLGVSFRLWSRYTELKEMEDTDVNNVTLEACRKELVSCRKYSKDLKKIKNTCTAWQDAINKIG